jgi:hypothetical protein
MTRCDVGKPAFSLRKKTLRENTCAIASGDYSTPVSQRSQFTHTYTGRAASQQSLAGGDAYIIFNRPNNWPLIQF